jgi:hypothetical protein
MIRLHWQDELLTVRRLVLRADTRDHFAHTLLPLARRAGLVLGDESADLLAGDFWVGCHPEGGWADADPSRVGWASLVEVPVAVAALLEAERPGAVRDEVIADRTARGVDQPLRLQFA